MGKTIQAIYAAIGNTMVIVPDYLKKQWAKVLRTQHPDDIVYVCEGTKVERIATMLRAAKRATANVTATSDTDANTQPRVWLIANKEMLRQYPFDAIAAPIYDEAEGCDTPPWTTLIIDEAHHFRKENTQQAKGALDLSRVIPRVYLLTATPIIKDPDDLFMQLRLIDEAQFTSYWQFCKTYLVSSQTQYGMKIYGVRHAPMESLMRRYSIGHTYKQVGLQLPRLIPQEILFDLPPEIRQRYNMVRDYWRDQERNYTNALSAMQALRRITACAAKFDVVKDLVDDLYAADSSHTKQSDSGVVTFAWYRDSVHAIAEAIGATPITGDTKADDRATIARNSTNVACTLAAMSEGVDLSHARTVIFAEEYWTPGTQIQALARVQRWSEADNSLTPVLAYYVMAQGTIDVTVHERLHHRKETLQSIMNAELDS